MDRAIIRYLILLVWLTCPAMSVTAFAGQIIYVDDDANGLNDGSSWENAYLYLQDALADANSAEKPIEIRVAQGTYKPDQGADVPYPPTWPANLDYRATFNLINGVTIKGGYAGFAEPDPNFRDIELYKTILSGDLNGDDVDVNDPGDLFDAPKRGDNSSNVVTGSNTDATAVLDGFTISGGAISVIPFRRSGGSPAGGAGMLIFSGNPTLINCTFTDNVTGNTGGGLLIHNNSNPTLTNCTFTRNYAESGGGIFSSGSSPTLIDCIFGNNYVQHDGSGMFSYDGNPKLTDCTFRNNHTSRPLYGPTTKGGGMYNINSSPVLTDCTFIENSADSGGAMYNKDSSPTLVDCVFKENTAPYYAGAICTDGGQLIARGCVFAKNYPGAISDYSKSGSVFTNCIFTGNSGPFEGGAVRAGNVTFTRCLFAGNRSLGYHQNEDTRFPSVGGAVFVIPVINKSTVFTNCTFINNWADFGCAVYCFGWEHLTNCIFWGSGDQIYVYATRPPTVVRYSDVQGGWPGEGNIDAEPHFADPGRWVSSSDPNQIAESNDQNAVWIDGDYHLKSQAGRWDSINSSWIKDNVTSPCIDAGDLNSPIGFEPFPNGGIINMGAYGGTVEASKSYFGEPVCETIVAGDINGDCKVDFVDFAIMALHWLEQH